MAKNKDKSQPRPQQQGDRKAGQGGAPTLALWLRVVISLAVAWHLLAVFMAPLSVPPSSELVSRIAQPTRFRDQSDYLGVQWYTDALYLNHGYHFFAPDPPVNQLVRYAVTDESGAIVAEGEFPNTEQQWPRLYYHRHMMLADQAPLMPAPEPQAATQLALRSYARYLLRRHDGAQARLEYVRHAQLNPFEVLEGADPNTPERFERLASVVEYRADLETPLVQPPAAEASFSEPIPPGAVQ